MRMNHNEYIVSIVIIYTLPVSHPHSFYILKLQQTRSLILVNHILLTSAGRSAKGNEYQWVSKFWHSRNEYSADIFKADLPSCWCSKGVVLVILLGHLRLGGRLDTNNLFDLEDYEFQFTCTAATICNACCALSELWRPALSLSIKRSFRSCEFSSEVCWEL